MTAINRKMVNIAIMDAGTNPGAVLPTDYIKGEIKNYTKSGGEQDVESDPHFGGDVDKEKPRSQFEISFEITPSIDDADMWENFAYANVTVGALTVFVSNVSADDKAVFIQTQGTLGTPSMSYAFNNCNVTTLDMSHNADDNMSKTLNLKFGSEDSNGVSNFISAETDLVSMPAWSALP